ncbi:MAG TPA: 3-deoxy-D-manno-octulosonic acid transferase [Candidatus Sulfotelmatobacter sp.]|nr:3-deoxy-D-manno-octulosonic acid transferase [Candidatus Sulfotelmatobacter sp.]
MSYFLYSFTLALAMLVSLPYWLYQMLRHGKYRAGLAERLGRVPQRLLDAAKAPAHSAVPEAGEGRTGPCPGRIIWIHAVSVGEVLAVSGLVEKVQRDFPDHRVLLSTTTDTGQALARKRFGEANVFYFPMDFGSAIRPYLRALQPEVVVLAETEFWPNFLRLAHASGARIAVVNARISDRSWPNYRRFRWALRKMLAHVDLFLAQTETDKARLQSIGADPQRVQITGNLKFDLSSPASPAIVDSLRQALSVDRTGPILVCGSTVEGEEPLLLKAFENLRVGHPRALMMLAPRHPERFDEVAILVRQLGIPFFRRSQWQGEALTGGVLLIDSIGELAALYALADVAFVGGSLLPRGGHNIIEPAQHGVAIVTGNHTENFRDIVRLFQRRDAVRIVGMAELPLTLMQLLADDAERRALGRRAQETMRSQMGATVRTLEALKALVGDKSRPAPAQAAHTD